MTAMQEQPPGHGASRAGTLAFEGVTLRMFPLRANPHRLKQFCDRYLNIAPQIAHFRPAGPFVFLMAINYGRMSAEAVHSQWIAQREFMFTIPLEWHEVGSDGRKVFKDWASVSPFIFVDDPLSIKAGREVYGWPKVLARMKPDVNSWMQDPRADRRLLSLETLLPSQKLYAGQPMTNRVLLEVDQVASQAAVRLPPEPFQMFEPLARLPLTMMRSYASVWETSVRVARLWSRNASVRKRTASVSPLDLFQQCIGVRGLSAVANTINLKQFRGARPDDGKTLPAGTAADPGLACYQSLVNAKMRFERFNGGGLMGSLEALRGDASGGFRIRVHRHGAYPIVESLGLAPDATSHRRHADIDILRPMAPFWMSFDFSYDLGERICWRNEMEPDKWWTRETADGRRGVPQSTPECKCVPVKASTPLNYNTSLGPIASPMVGPFDFFDTNVRVLPLLARYPDGERIAQSGQPDLDLLLDVLRTSAVAEVGKANPMSLDAQIYPRLDDPTSDEKRTLVFMICTNRSSMSSEANDVGWWAKQSISFAYLIKGCFTNADETVNYSRYWLAPVFGLADSPLAVTTGREVAGLNTHLAEIKNGVDPWLEDGGAHANRRLMSVHAPLFPAGGVGQTRTHRTFVEVEQVLGNSAEREEGQGAGIVEQVEKLLCGGGALRSLTIKSFKDEERPHHNADCYNALVGGDEIFASRRHDGRGAPAVATLDGPLRVKVLRETDHDLVTRLGLISDGEELQPDGTTMVALANACGPFSIRSDVRAKLPRCFTLQAFSRDSVDQAPAQALNNIMTYLKDPGTIAPVDDDS